MNCPKCGAELSEDTKFCSYCGEKIEYQPENLQEHSVSNNNFGKGVKPGKSMKMPKPDTNSSKKSIDDTLKEKGIEYWNSLSIFGKIVAVSIIAFVLLSLVGLLVGKAIAVVFSVVQIALVIVALLMNKGAIKSPNT